VADDKLEFLKAVINVVLDRAWWFIITLFLLAAIRNTVSRAIEGAFWKMGKTYNVDDAVVIDGRRGRITRQNIWVTVFYIYTWEEGQRMPSGGTIMVVSNTELGRMKIEKPLVLHSGRWVPDAPEVHERPMV